MIKVLICIVESRSGRRNQFTRRNTSISLVENDTWPQRKQSLPAGPVNAIISPRRGGRALFHSMGSDIMEFDDSEMSVTEEIESSVDGIENENEMVSDCLNFLSKNYSKSQLTEKLMKCILKFSNATAVYFIRTNQNGKFVLDCSFENGKWDCTNNQKFSNNILNCIVDDCKKDNESIYVVSNHELKWLYKINDCKIESIMCIPVVLSKKVAGMLYLTHESKKMAFDHIKRDLMSLLMSNLILSNNSKKPEISTKAIRTPSVDAASTDVLLQDIVKIYDEEEDVWRSSCIALTKSKLIFNFSHGMIPQHIVIYNIKSWKCATARQFKSSNIPIPSYNGKSWFNKQYWLQITTTKNQKYWFSFEQFETAKNWKEEMESLMNEIKCTENNIPNNIRISEKDVSKGRPIGKGAAASVFRGTLNQNTVAIKEFYAQPNMEEHREFLDEMEMLSSLHHPNIIRLFGGFINKSQSPCIVMEYASRGSLNSVLYDSMTDLTSSLKLQFIQQIAQALNYLHTFNPPIIHRDLKPSNILVS